MASASPPLIVSSPSVPATNLPRDVLMNKDAGRGNELFITIQLDSGQKFPFLLDTGSSTTVIDKSLEPLLGKCLSRGDVHLFGKLQPVSSYLAPALYLGNTRLMMTGPYIAACDCSQMATNADRSVFGIIGMDVLGHYCLQLDFAANKIRFLDDRQANKNSWGKSLPLNEIGDGCYYLPANLAGIPGVGSLVDTGCNYDGWLIPQLFQQWNDPSIPPANGETRAPSGILNQETYPALYLRGLDTRQIHSGDQHLQFNGIGLQFLARHLVTLDFPQKTLYLKRTSVNSLVDKDMQAEGRVEGKSALKFLKGLIQKGRLPGWSADDKIASLTVRFQYPHFVTFDHMLKKGDDSSIYHYQVDRPFQNNSWRLLKAWRTDPSGHTVQEYSIP